MNEPPIKKIDWLVLPIIGALLCLGVWHLVAGKKVYTLKSGGMAELHASVVPNLPNGEEDWKRIKPLIEAGAFERIKTLSDGSKIWPALEPSLEEKRVGLVKELPNVNEAWNASRPYVTEPFVKRGELDQGILRFTWLSLVAKGYLSSRC
jgi:hypothetical protein